MDSQWQSGGPLPSFTRFLAFKLWNTQNMVIFDCITWFLFVFYFVFFNIFFWLRTSEWYYLVLPSFSLM